MGFLERIFGDQPTQLKLSNDSNYQLPKIGMPKPPPMDFTVESLVKYSKKSELVYACIDKKAQAACDAEIVVEKRVQGEWERLDAHPLMSLLNKPNPWDNGESFIKAWVASENVADNFYCEIVRSNAGIPVALYPLNPIYLVPQWVMGTGSWMIDFYWYFQTGYPVRLEVTDLLVRRRHGIGSIFSDTSNLAVALGSVDADTATTEYIRAFFNNGGAPSGILLNKGRKLTNDEAMAMQQKWVQRYGRGGTNRGGVAVLDADQAEYQTVGAKLNELNSDSLDEKTETRICMAFGVPPIVVGARVGLKHVTQNATAKAAMGEFWQHTMSPELKSMRNWLTWDLLPMFEPIEAIRAGQIRVNWDMSQVVALQEDVDGVHSRVGTGYQNGIYTLNEARSAVGLDAVAPEVGDQFFKPPAPVHVVGNGQEPPPEKPPKKELTAGDETKDVIDAEIITEKKTFDFNGLTLGREPTELEKTLDLKGMVQASNDGRDRLAKVILNVRDGLIKQAQSAVNDIAAKDVHELVLTPPEGAYNGVRKVVDSLFETGRKQVNDDLNRQRSKGIVPLESKKPGDKWRKFIERIVERTVSRLVNEVQTRAINFFAARGLLDPNDDKIISELRAALEDQSSKTYEDIAAQAANAAIGSGRDAEIEVRSADIQYVEYSAVLDANTCDPCDEADGMTGETSADLPDAPNPDCEGGARCRCFHVAVGKEENA